ncbi:HopJ type III effector protein [Niabella yanshanensis]|uniref:HopJ type III effector protein n=1 Tax=Niabella yanshanensis TaxID=577386 RepID=A0ABZ0W7Z4_9BACT|nr:HopJ type III effector protein [Niabella yanshanensis]WQD39408.1 HopJ type III effector protein [Niabella yanshanensis]
MAISKQEIDLLLSQLNNKEIKFSDILQFIEAHYTHTPAAFKNGEQLNAASENQGSAKVLRFAQLNKLSETDTLKLFAEHYDDVVATPNAVNHQNIRQFMQWGWEGVRFDSEALAEK